MRADAGARRSAPPGGGQLHALAAPRTVVNLTGQTLVGKETGRFALRLLDRLNDGLFRPLQDETAESELTPLLSELFQIHYLTSPPGPAMVMLALMNMVRKIEFRTAGQICA
jgi:hypothetical protein